MFQKAPLNLDIAINFLLIDFMSMQLYTMQVTEKIFRN